MSPSLIVSLRSQVLARRGDKEEGRLLVRAQAKLVFFNVLGIMTVTSADDFDRVTHLRGSGPTGAWNSVVILIFALPHGLVIFIT